MWDDYKCRGGNARLEKCGAKTRGLKTQCVWTVEGSGEKTTKGKIKKTTCSFEHLTNEIGDISVKSVQRLNWNTRYVKSPHAHPYIAVSKTVRPFRSHDDSLKIS